MVKTLAGVGMKPRAIARQLEIRSLKTLRKHFRNELDLGLIQATAQVAQTYFQMATSGKYPAVTERWLQRYSRLLAVEPGEAKPADVIPDFIVSIEEELHENRTQAPPRDGLPL